MTSCRGYVYRLYPTKEQCVLIAKTVGCARFVYNNMLSASKEAHERGENLCSRNAFNYRLTKLKDEFPWLREVDATALTSANDHLAASFAAFFKGKSSYPKYHKKKSSGSYTAKCVNNNIVIGERSIRLPKLGAVRAVIHRHVPEN